MADERTDAEKKEARREVARANLDNEYMGGLATARIGTPDQYGQLLKGIYEQTVSKTPNQETYKQLFLPALTSDTGTSLNRDYLQSTATGIIQESIFTLPADEILGMIGVSEDVAKKYFGKEMGDLSKDEKELIVNTYFTNMVERQIEERLPQMREARAKNLERLLTESSE